MSAAAARATLATELRPPIDRVEALAEADRCLECGGPYAPAPCMVACPAEVDVAGFIGGDRGRRSGGGGPNDLRGEPARRDVRAGVPGRSPVRICLRPRRRGRRPIAIGALQRYATDQALEAGRALRERAPSNGLRVAVIGAGPAGLVCAGELAARGYGVTVFDEREEIGGLVRYAIAPYRQLREPLPRRGGGARAHGRRVPARLAGRRQPSSRSSLRARTLSSSASAWAPTPRSRIRATTCPGVWESLPFIEAHQDRAAACGRRATPS